ALGIAVFHRNFEMVRLLLAAGADVNSRGAVLNDYTQGPPRRDLAPPLVYAAFAGVQDEMKAILELLLLNKADVNAQDEFAKSGLSWAVERGNAKTVKLLLENGADPNIKNEDGDTPLHLCKSKEIAELLLAKNADVKARNKSGRTPLHH